MAILYFLGEESVQNDQQQDCCLIVEVHAPDGIDSQWVQQAAENAIEQQFGKRLTLRSTNEDEALQYLQADQGPTHGALKLAALFYHLARIV
jgi:hypothetical protein